MMSGEILVILVVAIIVFGPNKLPMLAEHLGKLYRQLNRLKEQAMTFWHSQIEQQQLQENIRKAEKADVLYQGSEKKNEPGLTHSNSRTNETMLPNMTQEQMDSKEDNLDHKSK